MTVDVDTDAPFLMDSGNRRLVWLSSDGTLLREQPFPHSLWSIKDVVALADGSGYLASIYSREGIDLIRLSSDGQDRTILTPDWPGFRDMESLQLDMLVFAGSGASGGLAFRTGNGFFVLANDVARAHPYVERVDFPEVVIQERTLGPTWTKRIRFVERPAESAYDVDTKGDTLFVLTSDSDRRGLLDLYSMATGRYVESRLLPGRFRSFSLAGDTIYVVDQSDVVPRILALVARENES